MNDLQPLADVPLIYLILLGVCAAGGWLLLRRAGALKAAMTLVDEQHDVLDQAEVDAFREKLPATERQRATPLFEEIRRADDGVVRKGHLIWVLAVVEGQTKATPVPHFRPPAGTPYRLEHDIGVPAFRRFMVEKAAGDLVGAYAWLRKAAERGSPLAMTSYGVSLVMGDVPGSGPDPKASHWIERAIELSGSAMGTAELGRLLVEGKHLPRNLDRGLALLARDPDVATWDLAEIHRRGLYGATPSVETGLKWAMKAAPRWRRSLARCGFSQVAWMDRQLEFKRVAEQTIEDMSPWERRAAEKRAVDEMGARIKG